MKLFFFLFQIHMCVLCQNNLHACVAENVQRIFDIRECKKYFWCSFEVFKIDVKFLSDSIDQLGVI
jgi:hypothetical protein